tara:strand:+ start:19 stop:204 length:186 start_codon:yes stop_codon:yes gene_type:complete
MQFEKKTRLGNLSSASKIILKLSVLLLIIFIAIVMIDKINFPKPNKTIENIIPNEKIKIIK